MVGRPVGVRVPPSAPVEIRRRSKSLGAFFYFDWCSLGARTGEGADEQEEERDFEERVSPKPRRKSRSRNRGG